MSRAWEGFVRFLGWLLCASGLHVPPENTNVQWVPCFWCTRCGKQVDGGLAAQNRRRLHAKNRRGM
jgi:hypothetical protein